MDAELRSLICETFGEVLETMFFTFLEPVDEIPGPDALVCDDPYIRANISYHGPLSGRFTIYLPQALARSITTNFLGVDERDVSQAQMLDTAKETANMTVGSLLGKIDPGGESKLHIPEARLIEWFSAADLQNESGLLLFNTDFGPLWVVFEQ